MFKLASDRWNEIAFNIGILYKKVVVEKTDLKDKEVKSVQKTVKLLLKRKRCK